jgi:excinuclease UvrABC helicase subunit UvrB
VEEYLEQVIDFEVGKRYSFEKIISDLINLQFKRATSDFKP